MARTAWPPVNTRLTTLVEKRSGSSSSVIDWCPCERATRTRNSPGSASRISIPRSAPVISTERSTMSISRLSRSRDTETRAMASSSTSTDRRSTLLSPVRNSVVGASPPSS